MRPRYKVSQAGVDLIEAFEGFRPTSARLDDGRWTIGYGHTRSAREDTEVSREDALILLRWVDLPPVEEAINALVEVPLTQNQYDALVAFVFNVGVEAFAESEALEHLNAGRVTEAACALELWRKADIAGDPVVLDALIRRRAAEKALFLAPQDGVAPSPSPLVRPRPDARAAQFVPARRPAEIEAPLTGARAEVRLVAPYDIEPEPEAPTAFAPQPAEPEPVAEPALVWAAEAPTAFTPEPEPEPAAELAAEPAPESALEPEAPTAFTTQPAEPEPAAEPAPESALEPEAPTAFTTQPVEPQPAAEAAPESAPEAATAPTAEAAESEAEETPEEAAAPIEGMAAWSAWTAWAGKVAETAVRRTELAAGPELAPTASTVEAAAEPAPQTADEAPDVARTEAVAAAEPEVEPEPAPTAGTAELEAARAEAPQEAASTAEIGESVEAGAQEPEAAPTIWSLELPHAASVALHEEPAPASWTVEPAETDWDEPAPSSWIIGVTPTATPAEPATPAELEPAALSAETPAAEPVAGPETDVAAEPTGGSEPDAAAEVEAPAAAEAAPAATPAPEEILRPMPAVNSVLQTRALPEAAPRPRPLYSSYGPMAFAVAPPPAKAVEAPSAAAGERAPAAREPAPQAAQSQPAQVEPLQRRPHFQPLPELTVPTAALEPAQPVRSFAPPVPAEGQPPATASAPAVTAEAAPARPLVLTSPPADWEEPRAVPTNASQAAGADELETPLFDEGWDGPGALSGRIVHHEATVEHDARATRLGVAGPYVLLGFIGFVAFGGALFAFSRGHSANGGAGNPVILAWVLALFGAACVGVSVYFLLKRLGGQED